MPRIVNVSPYYHIRGGSDSYFMAQTELLRRNGFEIAPFCVRSSRNRPSEWSKYFVTAAELRNPSPLDVARFIYSREARRNIRRLIQDFSPDLVHLHIFYGHFTSSILSVIRDEFDIPIVQTVHDYKPVCPVYSLTRDGHICEDCNGSQFWRALPRRCNRGSIARTAISVAESYASRALGNVSKIDRFVAVSHFQADKLVALGMPEDRVRVAHNFIDVERISERGHPPRKPRFVYFGRMEPTKGIFDILEAARSLPDYEFVFAGDGSGREALLEQIHTHGLSHVTAPGFVEGEALEALVRSATATMLTPYVYENFGMSVMESMAAGVPVIGSRMGGIPELISDDSVGVLVDPSSPEQLREAIVRLASDPDASASMGRAARRRIAQEFSAERHLQTLIEIYRDLGVER